jgi:hypothetical protein
VRLAQKYPSSTLNIVQHTICKTHKFITGQNEREETTQDAIVTKSAAFASYEINYLTQPHGFAV